MNADPHRAKAKKAIIAALTPLILGHGETQKATLDRLAEALMTGSIPHVEYRP